MRCGLSTVLARVLYRRVLPVRGGLVMLVDDWVEAVALPGPFPCAGRGRSADDS